MLQKGEGGHREDSLGKGSVGKGGGGGGRGEGRFI